MRVAVNNFSNGINTKIDENLSRWKYAKNCYNFQFFDGSLKTSRAFETLKTGISTLYDVCECFIGSDIDIEKGHIFYFRKYIPTTTLHRADKLIVFDNNLVAYYINLYVRPYTLVPLNITFTSAPRAVNYRLNSTDVIILTSPTDNMVVWDGDNSPQVITSAPKISSMTVHYERLFATTEESPTELWFSDDLDPTNWNINLSDAGFIQMLDDRGELKKVISYNDYLYIFREFGISRLSASGSQDNFYLSHLFVSSGKIYENTAQLCGDKIIFMASNGMYRFDGIDTTPILTNMSSLITVDEYSSSAYFEGKYYLACNVKYDSGTSYQIAGVTNNAVLVVDMETLQYEILRGLTVEDMTIVSGPIANTIVFLSHRANAGEYLVMPAHPSSTENLIVCEESVWDSGYSDLGINKKQKVIRKIGVFVSYGKPRIDISNENGLQFSVDLNEGTNVIPTNIVGEKFCFTVKNYNAGTNSACVSGLYVDIY